MIQKAVGAIDGTGAPEQCVPCQLQEEKKEWRGLGVRQLKRRWWY